MKMQDILIKEAPAGKVPPQPTLNGKPSTGPKGQAWLKKYGATHNPDGTPKAAGMDPAAMAAQGTAMRQPATATTPPPQANALGVQAQAGGAFGQTPPQPDNPNPPNGAAAAMASQSAPAAEPPPQPDNGLAQNPEIVSPEVGKAQAASQSVAPAAPAPAPQGTAATYAQTNPDTGLSTEPGKVKTGTGGTTNLTTASQDEYAWRAKNPNWNMMGLQYPGAGKWDPNTGRTKRESVEYHEKDNALLGRMLQIAGLK
jgi:hypothetical protein